MGQYDPNNNEDANNNPGPPYSGAADGASGTTTIHRQGPVTRFLGTGALTASRAWKFGAVATEGWTDGDLVYLSLPEHTGAGFTITVQTIAGATLCVWGALAANGGAFWFNGSDFEAVIPGTDQGNGGGGGSFWVNGNQNGPVANQSTSASIGVGGAPPTPAAGAFQVRADSGASIASGHAPIVAANSIIHVTATGSLVLGASGGQFGASMSGSATGAGGGISLGAGDFAPMFVDGHLEVRATLAARFWTAGTCLADVALTSADASSLLDVASVTRGARPWPTMTTAQRNAIVAPAAGLKVYCSDVVIGDFEYNGVGYVPYGFSQSGTGALTAGALVVTNVYLSASSVVTISVGTPAPGAGSLTIRYDVLQASRTSGFGTGSFTISALLAAGTLNNLDTSTNVRWAISGT